VNSVKKERQEKELLVYQNLVSLLLKELLYY